MKYFLSFLLLTSLFSRIEAQRLAPTDTLKLETRTFGDLQALTQQMDGFGANFFFNPQQTLPDATSLYLPGLTTFTDSKTLLKPLVFSALPHLGFGYGFGAQGTQRIRVDFEQAFTKGILLNLRYDRWQRTGFIRADDVRYSQLQLNLYQVGKRHEVLLHFGNASDDRQWAGGLASYTALGSIAMDLLPVVKESSRTQKNAYQASLDFRYRLFGDSLRSFNLATLHQYQLQKRLYLEEGPLSTFYPQTYFSPDSCADVFNQQRLENRVGLQAQRPGLELTSQIGLRQRLWSDALTQYDTLELNWHNHLQLKRAAHDLAHQNEFNISGAAQGWHANSTYRWAQKNWKVAVEHRFANEWPLLLQRAYQSNLTNYFWSNPQKQFFQELSALGAYQNNAKTLSARMKISLIQYKNAYRFDPLLILWSTTAAASAGQLATLQTDISYTLPSNKNTLSNGGWVLGSKYKYLAQKDAFLPKHQAALTLAWQGGVFKDKRLNMRVEGQVTYQSVSKTLVYLPFMESLDWGASQLGAVNAGYLNAQFNVALEVKTFRFFVNVANLGSYWNNPQLATVQGYPFPTMQIRLGLTWDFFN
ncbi:MAG: putative porin [Crocinitomicaceae bacterium]|nr:putative porin [Crocinitomicaceae bacterium]